MARIRTVKPAFFFNEELAALPAMTRLFFIGIWTQVDREGRCEDRPIRLKANLFPYDDCDVEQMILELVACGHLVRYSVGGVKVLAVPNFLNHQIPHYKEAPSILPDIPADFNVESTLSQPVLTLSQPYTQEGKGREQEGKGREGGIAPSPSDSKPPVLIFNCVGSIKTWELTEEKVAEWSEAYPGVNVLTECRKARQWCIDKPARNKTARGMTAFLGSWLSRQQNSGRGNGFNSKVSGSSNLRTQPTAGKYAGLEREA